MKDMKKMLIMTVLITCMVNLNAQNISFLGIDLTQDEPTINDQLTTKGAKWSNWHGTGTIPFMGEKRQIRYGVNGNYIKDLYVFIETKAVIVDYKDLVSVYAKKYGTPTRTYYAKHNCQCGPSYQFFITEWQLPSGIIQIKRTDNPQHVSCGCGNEESLIRIMYAPLKYSVDKYIDQI